MLRFKHPNARQHSPCSGIRNFSLHSIVFISTYIPSRVNLFRHKKPFPSYEPRISRSSAKRSFRKVFKLASSRSVALFFSPVSTFNSNSGSNELVVLQFHHNCHHFEVLRDSSRLLPRSGIVSDSLYATRQPRRSYIPHKRFRAYRYTTVVLSLLIPPRLQLSLVPGLHFLRAHFKVTWS